LLPPDLGNAIVRHNFGDARRTVAVIGGSVGYRNGARMDRQVGVLVVFQVRKIVTDVGLGRRDRGHAEVTSSAAASYYGSYVAVLFFIRLLRVFLGVIEEDLEKVVLFTLVGAVFRERFDGEDNLKLAHDKALE